MAPKQSCAFVTFVKREVAEEATRQTVAAVAANWGDGWLSGLLGVHFLLLCLFVFGCFICF